MAGNQKETRRIKINAEVARKNSKRLLPVVEVLVCGTPDFGIVIRQNSAPSDSFI